MNQRENPASTGLVENLSYANIPETEPQVKPSANANLIFFHTTFSDLPAEDYKAMMSAVAMYAMSGTIPALSGSLKVIFALAKDKIDGAPKQARKRGAPIGNKNACKIKSAETEKQFNSIKNNSDLIDSKLNQMPSIAVNQPVQPTASVAVEPLSSRPQLNLNNNLNNNILFNNYLKCEQENESERKKRIQTALKRFGFILSDKVIAEKLATIPDIMWLTDGADFPSYLAQYVVDAYKGKGKNRVELQKLYLSAWNREKWETPWETYPNWLSERMERILIDKKALIRKTPPQNTCKDCGEPLNMAMMKCPKCGGYYQWSEEKQAHEWFVHFVLDEPNAMQKLLTKYVEKQRREANAQTV